MTSSPSPAPGPEDPAPEPASEHRSAPAGGASSGAAAGDSHNGFFAWIRSLGVVRGRERWFGGVATGIAARTGLDPVLVRGLFVVLGVFGVGFLVYGVAWALLPEPDGRIHVEEASRGNWTTGMTGALIFAVLGMGGPGVSFLGADGWFGATVWTLFWIAAGIGAIYWFSSAKGKGHLPWEHPAGGHTGSAPTDSAPGPSGGVSLAKTGMPEAGSRTAGPGAGFPATRPTDQPQSFLPYDARAPHVPGKPHDAGTAPQSSGEPHTGHGSSCANPAVKVPGAPGAYLASVFGAALLVGGAVFALDYANIWNLGTPVSVALAAAAVVLGLGVAILGLAGRRSGGVGTVAVLALVVSFLAQGGMTNANLVALNDGDWSPRNAAEAQGGYTAVAGNGTVDLRNTSSSGNYEVPVSVAAGNLSFLVPEDSPVTVRFTTAAGNVQIHDGTRDRDYSGLWQPSSEQTLNGDADGDRITINIRSVAGNVLVTTDESDL